EMTIDEKIELALEHARMVCDRFGPKGGALMMRKHLSWYSKGFLGGAELRRRLKTVCSYEDISSLLRAYREGSLDVANQ
ncbi:MAG: tRNA-dihydrouridine synthase, partial [Candidatus Zixiibacteriota bacterium]